jgi:glycosyltransferase involved in cell wall biosynthesis
MVPIIKVIIPAYNEENSIAKVIADIPKIVSEIIVINNNSTDATFEVAKNAGAFAITETNKGYGYACLKGLEYIAAQEKQPDIIVFLDGDYSDYPEELTKIVTPIIEKKH